MRTSRSGKKAAKIACALAAMAASVAGAAEYYVYHPENIAGGPYNWNSAGAWHVTTDLAKQGSPVEGVPPAGYAVYLFSDIWTAENPLTLAGSMGFNPSPQIGLAASTSAANGKSVYLKITDGALFTSQLLVSNPSTVGKGKIYIASAERATVEISIDNGGVMSNDCFQVGSKASIGRITIGEGGKLSSFAGSLASGNGLTLGSVDTATGLVGTGEVVNVAGTLSSSWTVAGNNGGVGRFVFRGGDNDIGQFYVGYTGPSASYPGVGEIEIHEGAAVFVNNLHSGFKANGCGRVQMKGGELLVQAVWVRENADADCEIRGWGAIKFMKKQVNKDTGETEVVTRTDASLVNNGRIVADGEGVDGRVLDMQYISSGYTRSRNITCSIFNGLEGTNGFFAVNKGSLLYPTLDMGNEGTIDFSVGDTTNRCSQMINSIGVRYTRPDTTGGRAIAAKLIAADSSLVPQPEFFTGRGEANIGTIGLWVQKAWNNPELESAGTLKQLRFRYDHRGLGSRHVVSLYRYENGAWNRLARQSHDPENPYLIVGSDETPLGFTPDTELNGQYNIGLYAIGALKKTGFCICIR